MPVNLSVNAPAAVPASGPAPRLPALAWCWRLVLCLLAPFPAFPAEEISNYVILRWEMEDGLPLSKVRALAQTPDGYLWVGTFNGLARFDGVKFTVFDVSNTPDLKNNRIESLAVDGHGRLWIGDNLGGLTLYHEGRFQPVTMPSGWPKNPILRIVADRDETVWAMNDLGGLASLTAEGDAAMFPLNSSPNLLAAGRDGRAWVIADRRLCALDPLRGAVPLPGGPDLPVTSQALFAGMQGGLWILNNGLLRRWSEDAWVEDRGRVEWGTIVLAAFFEARSGEIFAGSFKEGLRILAPDGTVQHLTEANGLAHNWVYCLFEDRERNVWLGTGNGGLNSLQQRRVSMVSPPDEWHSSAVLSVSRTSAGGLWIGTEGGGIYQLTPGGDFTRHESSGQIWNSVVNSVMEDRGGQLWAGTWNSGVGYFSGNRFVPVGPTSGDRSVVLTVFQSSTGGIWAGTRRGPGLFQDNQWNWFDDEPRLAGFAARCFAELPDGTVWCGLDGGGLARIRDGAVEVFREQDGLPSGFISTLYADASDLWIGTQSGLCRFRDGAFAVVSSANGLPSDVVRGIVEDRYGFLWIASLGGIFRVSKSELNACADGALAWIRCLICDTANGLASLEVSGQGQPTACQTADGRLWFATGRGLAMVDPSGVTKNNLPPPVLVEEVLWNGRAVNDMPKRLGPPPAGSRVAAPATLRLGPGSGRLELRYTGLSLTNPRKLGFRYRLEGIEDDWVDAGQQRLAIYPSLPPGSYTFTLMARNADGVWNESVAALPVIVAPHFWQTFWFRAGSLAAGVLAILGVALAVMSARARSRLALIEGQRAIEAERGRIARDIHDDLGSSLTRIVMLSEQEGDRPDDGFLESCMSEINDIARRVTLKMSEIVWAVNPAHDTLDSMANFVARYAREYFANCGIRCRLDIPVNLPQICMPPPVRHNLLLALKEACQNVLKHARASEVRLSLGLEADRCVLTLEDNGCGFDVAREQQSATGNGLRNIRHRLAQVNGCCDWASQPSAGCRVQLAVPLLQHRDACSQGGKS